MVIIGLGNPGKEYENTRHNVGFSVLEKLADRLRASSWKKEFGVRWSKIGTHWLIEPWQYMNTSGPTLKSFLQKKNVNADITAELIVAHDDVDFPLGELHEQFDRSAAGHNGVQSLVDIFGQKFYRIRIGIGHNRDVSLPAEKYVLQKFSDEEQPAIETAVNEAVEILTKKISGSS